ncbi:MAG TPA: VCBS repeat-containing protein, partial [Cyclobacteriaceae bacterium]|nr:VCBS repeat-containing protein [Cyclobacteriaceae bacterium]
MAQFTYSIDQTIPVEKNGESLDLAWAGGLNAAQLNTMDLNGDNKQDLVIFDRAANKVITYLNQNNHYVYSPEYESLFPAGVDQWMLLRDFDCDGKKDIFTSDPFGIRVFQNITGVGQNLTWKDLDILLTIGLSQNQINLKVNQSDIPAIDDVDGDGDLDVLSLQFASTDGMVEFHKNMSVENTGKCGPMQLQLNTKSWGSFTECECGQFALNGTTCDQLAGGRTEHVGGKALITIDFDHNGVRDLLFVEESCSNLYLLNNDGTKDNAHIVSSAAFPPSKPIDLQIFPAPYLEDVDFDGLADLIVSPNTYVRSTFNDNLKQSLLLYKNTGTTLLPSFTFVKSNFLQDEMIEIGDYAVPSFTDLDHDGDLDMFIGAYSTQTYRGSIYHFENIGTRSSPSFRYVTDDFLGLKAAMISGFNPPFYGIKPQFADMNADGETDLAFTATNPITGITRLYYIPSKNNVIDFSTGQFVTINVTIGATENLYIIDINHDGA